jgi:hypothetical protein
MLQVKIKKISINSDTDLAILNNDFSLSDNHPNIKIGDEIIGFVSEENLKPVVGESYSIVYDLEAKLSTSYFSTSKIVKIINDKTFMTKNSVYVIDILERKINYTYTVPYETIETFNFDKKNEIVDLTNYKILETEVINLANIISIKPDSRQAIYLHSSNNQKNCLISIQFLIEYAVIKQGAPKFSLSTKLSMIANYRSQHHALGMPHDIKMLNYLMTLFDKQFDVDFVKHIIYVNVADYHF